MNISELEVGQTLPIREHTASNVSLFMYNAAVWNHHRIHYDERYTVDVEKHPGVVIDGPLQGDWISQVALNWLSGAGDLLSFAYTNRRAAYLGETLTSGGEITQIDPERGEVELSLFIKNQAGEIITPGNARVKLA